MTRRERVSAVVAGLPAILVLVPGPAPLAAQALRGELDVRMNSVAFERYDGTPGADLVRSSPVVATLDVTAWDLGVRGLSLHARTSVTEDLAEAGAWPVTQPPVRLVEGYAEYATRHLTARAGRTPLHTRFGYESFDGARVDVRPEGWPITLTGFGGWSLARGSSLPVTSPESSPLDEFRPADRGLLAGGIVRAVAGPLNATAVFRREVDPGADKLTSELAGLSASLRPGAGVSVAAGADYDLGYDEWGTADARLAWSGVVGGRAVGLGASVRRYQPRFPLWSIWGAFSPVGYTTTGAHASVSPARHLDLRGVAERYAFEETGTSSPLASFEDGGWRWIAGAGWTGFADWALDAEFGAEFGPGAASTRARASAAWRPLADLELGAWLSRGSRPLEYRIDDAIVRAAGLDLRLDAGHGLSVDGGVAWFDEDRDAGEQRSFDHWRVHAGIRYGFGSSAADRGSLHPAILRIPERPGE